MSINHSHEIKCEIDNWHQRGCERNNKCNQRTANAAQVYVSYHNANQI